MSGFFSPNIYKLINYDNYLVNSYKHLTKVKSIHFLFILIEIMINIFQELEIFFKVFCSEEIHYSLNFISKISNHFDKLSIKAKLIILILYIIIFDSVYITLKLKKFKRNYIIFIILVNILELLFFRTFMLIFFNLIFNLSNLYLVFISIFLIPHLYLTLMHFLYNHLYYFVPKFIDYPYDEFSSQFDMVLLLIKLFLSIALTTSYKGLGRFCCFVFFFFEILFCIYFLYKLWMHSYLFMKNTFLNKTRISLFLFKTFIMIFTILLGKDEIERIIFPFISLGLIFIIMIFIYLLYNPLHYVKIKRETPMENIFFYLYILSDNEQLDFLFENKINEHYEKCGVCKLCERFSIYLKFNRNNCIKLDDEKESLISDEKSKNESNNNNDHSNNFMNLFDIIYNDDNKYFQLIKKIIINYKNKGKEDFINNSFYYINLSFLIYSDYQKNNITLSLNEKIILEVINKENKLLDNHEYQIKQILFCNEFISLGNTILTELKSILNSEQNILKAKKLVDLSVLLKEMKKPIYKNNLLNNKQENISNSKNLIMACSILYEEIFNEALNSSQIPIRDNIQILEDIFLNNKNDKIISLSMNLTNNNCIIIRAGKDLSIYKNLNLFELFPLVFKEFQINFFLYSVLNNFNMKEKKEVIINNNNKENKSLNKAKTSNNNIVKTIKPISHHKNKTERVEINIVICQDISSKIYYKLLTLKLIPLFNNDFNNYFLILDGYYSLHNNTLITIQDFEENSPKEKLIAVSEPELENMTDIYFMPFQKYIKWQNDNGYNLSNISKFHLSKKLYNIYQIVPRDKGMVKRKLERKNSISKEKKDENEEEKKSLERKKKIEQIIEDNCSVASQQALSTFTGGISGIGMRNKKKDNLYEYSTLNKIKQIIYILIPIILLVIIFEILILKTELNDNSKNNYNYLEFREIFQLYYQIFTSILGIICIQMNSTYCEDLATIYSNSYDFNTIGGYFNFSLYIRGQSQVLAKQIMEKRSNLVNIHKNIGNDDYNLIFGKIVKYTRLTQTFIDNKAFFNLTYVNIQFSEAILIICNSYQILTNYTSRDPIFFVNKLDNPFSLLYEYNSTELSNYQKEVYEMILNYKVYRQQLNAINKKLNEILTVKSDNIHSKIYLYIYIDGTLILIFILLLYIYLINFENILIKILNFVNMTMNAKTENFNFALTFSQKIDNLETILQIYKGDPVKAVQNLTNIYSSYQKYLTAQNKSNANAAYKKNTKKISESDNKKSEMDNIPKNQKIVNRRGLRSLHTSNKYIFMIILSFLLLVGSFITLIFLWKNYFIINTNLYSLIKKNLSVEASLYKSMNFYDLMIFHNYTLYELSPKIFYQNVEGDNDDKSILRSLYKDVQNSFNGFKEKSFITMVYLDYGETEEFTCETLFEMNENNLEELRQNAEIKKIPDLKEKLINICKRSRLTETNDIITALQKHYQRIKNGILSLVDFSYKGLINHLINGALGQTTIFFNCILVYVLEVTNNKPHKDGIDNLLSLLNNYIIITESLFVGLDFFLILLSVFYFILKIKNYCSQFFLLKKIFKIFEIQEQ